MAFFKLPRGGRQAKLQGTAEMLQHAEPVPKSGSMALVDNDQIKEIRVVMSIELFSVQLFIKGLVVGKEDFADQVLALGDRFFVDGERVRWP